MLEVFHCEQNSPEWLALRRGLVTASKMATVLAKGEGKTRRRYVMELAAERCGGVPADSYSNGHMERGHLLEADARNEYAFLRDIDVTEVGFIKNMETETGCSPDGLIGNNGLLEIKTKLPHLQMEALLAGVVPPDHVAQIQAQMWIAEREFVDFVSYWPGLRPLIVTAYRIEPYIAELAKAVTTFNAEVAEVVESYRRLVA
jgi:hypothetical protein